MHVQPCITGVSANVRERSNERVYTANTQACFDTPMLTIRWMHVRAL